MKRVSILTMVVILLGCMSVMAMPKGEVVHKISNPKTDGISLVGMVAYEQDKYFKLDAGVSLPMNQLISSFPSSIYGYASLFADNTGPGFGLKLAWLNCLGESNMYWGLIAGAENNWENIPGDGQNAIDYLEGSIGTLLGYSWDTWGIFAGVERYSITDIEKRWLFRAGIHIDLFQ